MTNKKQSVIQNINKINLGMPEYVAKELEKRNIDTVKAMTAIFLDNQNIIDIFSNFIQSAEGYNALNQRANKDYLAFCLEEESSFIFGCAFIEESEYKNQLDVKISPFSKDTTDSHQDIINAIVTGMLWSLYFKYDICSNETTDVQVNWDTLLKTDLKEMVDRFNECHQNIFH